MSKDLTDEQILLARVLDCLASVTPSVLAGTSPSGARIGIPAKLLRELRDEVERQFPGVLAEVQRLTPLHRPSDGRQGKG